MNVVFVGVGAVGGAAAFLTLERRLGDVRLIDSVSDLAKGKAMDLSQAFGVSVKGSGNTRDLVGADIVVISAGYPRSKKMTRSELIEKNYYAISGICRNIHTYCPKAIVILVTNPVDELSIIARKYMTNQIIKVGNDLDTKRLKYYINKETWCEYNKITCLVTGQHNEHMELNLKNAKIHGEPLLNKLSKPEIKRITNGTIAGGLRILKFTEHSSQYGPAVCITNIIEKLKYEKDTIL